MTEKVPEGWKRVKLGEVVVFNYGKSLPKKKRIKGNVPVYSSAGITGWHNEALVNSKGIIVGRKGTIGKVYKSKIPFFPIDTCYYILPSKNYDFDFMYYLLKNLKLDELNEDSAVPGLNRNTAYSQEILLPPLPEQKAIASVLSSLDDKIDLLHRQNQTLEQMAQTLFRKWFIEDAKEDWEEVSLDKLGDFKNGINYSRNDNGDRLFKIINVRDIIGNRFIIGDFLEERKFERIKAESYTLQKFDILLVRSANPGESSLILTESNNIIFSGFTIRFRSYETDNTFFIFFYLQYLKNNLNLFSDGTIMKNITQEILKNIRIKLPLQKLIIKFNKIVLPILDKIKSNKRQIRILENLRNTLLPKLMSGKVRLKYEKIL